MTRDQFWHHLSGLPDPRDVHHHMISYKGAKRDDLKSLAKQAFGVSCKCTRNLHFCLPPVLAALLHNTYKLKSVLIAYWDKGRKCQHLDLGETYDVYASP